MSDQDDPSAAPANGFPRFLASLKNCAQQQTPEERLEGLIQLLVGSVPPDCADGARDVGEQVLEAARAYASHVMLRECAELLEMFAADQRAAQARRDAEEAWAHVLAHWCPPMTH